MRIERRAYCVLICLMIIGCAPKRGKEELMDGMLQLYPDMTGTQVLSLFPTNMLEFNGGISPQRGLWIDGHKMTVCFRESEVTAKIVYAFPNRLYNLVILYFNVSNRLVGFSYAGGGENGPELDPKQLSRFQSLADFKSGHSTND